ncbi:hypothetical protein MSG28_014809 [Choristoneura fumiferana]|uniref:Uncharacterized protein n=1 Tax=Choristoneura fumiferana TaxID=7141 RepID=A0ACC0JSQ7_CHOFU|nr:hypothetical protein MSG28_014809 [Choristoneura fumiferana]
MDIQQCRLCLSKDNLSPIFKDSNQCAEYSRILKLTTGLKITIHDGLPQCVCAVCTKLVNLALSPRNRSQTTAKKLKQESHKTIDTTPNFSDNEISECEECPVIKIEDNKKTDLKLEHENFYFKLNQEELNLECEIDIKKKTKSRRKLKKEITNEVEHNLPVSENVSTKEIVNTFIGSDDNISTEIADSNCGKQPEMSKKAKRAMYMELVEGDFDPKGPVKCKVCKKTVSKWPCFVSHAKLHLGFKFVCEYCGKSFISSTQLNRHCRSWHGMPRQLQCRQCSYLALDAPQLLLHVRPRHTASVPFVCSACAARTLTEVPVQHLESHRTTRDVQLHVRREHTGERPFVCSACAARYRSRRCLLQHLESHRTTRDVQCPDCGTLVKSRRHLARHRYSAHRRAPR